jgi:CxxC motif-containing protein (DUF1111 family)
MIKLFYYCTCFVAILLVLNSCKENSASPPEENTQEDDILSGGALTTFSSGGNAFSLPAPNLSAEDLDKHSKGDHQFEQRFVQVPAPINPGLGPLFNNNGCITCHVADGRGEAGISGTMLFRISIPGEDEYGGPNPVSGFGTQLQDKALIGYEPEGNVNITYTEISGKYPDGTGYSLQKPNYSLSGRISSGILLSPRIPPSVFGMGLLESIPAEDIISLADESDNNKDGISGKVNWVWNYKTNEEEIGRFGWKANTPTLLQQTASAYNEDIGITSPYFPLENCYSNGMCDTSNDDPEITEETLEEVTFYVQTLAVPARRNFDDAYVKRGKLIFKQVGCESCHVSTFTTELNSEIPELSNQKIHPYTDLLLHDMGDELADNRPDYKANGNEWRTAPLWGIGLIEIVNGHLSFLHDGRAKSLEEAILWHGGEAKKSKENFMNLIKSDRDALIKFLKSL